jgi:hypothetical protein
MSEKLHKKIVQVYCAKPLKQFRAVMRLLALLLIATPVLAQEIPKGVRYKPAPESVNAAAKTALEKVLASDELPKEFFGEVVVCGPMLWDALKSSADKILFDAKPIFIVIPSGGESIQTEGRGILKIEERQSFWRSLRAAYPSLKTAKVRKAHADEILHYWAEIPFDIEEPFFVVETNSERFVVNLRNKNDNITLFWIDVVGDLRSLK